ncbi:MAG TPA: DNA ligase D [Terracidiphilus sp.]|jgi:bifunctional non-homologous end joining protein LigD|nr:DNA ligase D [Terracidiphilus sp.]
MVKRTTRASKPAKGTTKRQLAKYRAKRDFGVTPEPSGEAKRSGPSGRSGSGSGSKQSKLSFVIQKHAATRLHYDFRLEWDGVLKSWAVAKGPSYFPGDKRLAVQVEDHPLEYGGFEGIIPQGQYGGGTVMLWDRGTWEPVGDAAEGLRKGNLKFILHGKKLHGQWVLVRMGGKFANQSKPSWLLIKERDGEERSASDAPITDEAPNSVASRRDMDAIGKAKERVWDSRAGSGGERKPSKEEKAQARAGRRSVAKSSLTSSGKSKLARLPKEALPAFVSPQLAAVGDSPPDGKAWVHELKLDGYRIQARLNTGERSPVRLLTRTGLDWTARLRPIAEALGDLPLRSALLDGEVVVLTRDGNSSFAELQAAFQEGAKYPLTYFIFDLLHLDGHNLRNLPLVERKEILKDVVSGLPRDGAIRMSEHLGSDGKTVFEGACKLGAEGIISKLAQGKYVSGRGNGWLKLKCYREQEFVIGGFTLPSNGIRGVGALLLGYYKNGKLLYAGRTGTGFTQKTHHRMRNLLEDLRSKTSPFTSVPAGMSRGVHWVTPKLVAQVSFSNWTADNLVRQAAFKGLREDKPAKSVQREEEKPVQPKRALRETGRESKPTKTAGRVRTSLSSESEGSLPIRLTHPDKVLDAETGLTKDALAHYYEAVSAEMLAHIAGRPVSLVRCMNGSGKPCFFQKHANETMPADVESVEIKDKKTGKPEPYITLSQPKALIELAQLSVLEIHAWGSKNDSLEKPDRLVIDLDPDATIDWKTLASAAMEVRARMKAAGLEPYLKTTGGKGLHVVAPMRPEHDWAAVKDFAHRMVLAMEADNPALYLTRMTKSARKGKIYLDYLRNERGATAIAPFSPRAREGVSVALPLQWSELKLRARPVFRVADFAAWKKRLQHDPWEGMLKKAPRLKL